MRERVDLSRIRKLRDESPTTIMGWLRLAWPDIKAALDRHVALKTIHQHLNDAGISISYPRLSLYIGRLRREQQREQTAARRNRESRCETSGAPEYYGRCAGSISRSSRKF
jgi:hypothetical protein